MILATRDTIAEQAEGYRAQYHALRTDPERNNQETIYEARYGLSAIGALYFGAYRFAQEEAAMSRVLKDPGEAAALFDLKPPAFPAQTDQSNDQAHAKANRRALHMLAAYRPAVLLDPDASPYVPDEVIAAEDSVAAARALLARIGRGDDLTVEERRARSIFDVRHVNRCNLI